ncbi:uncharacterized protein LOC132935078 [Metopolophium dirhodum]|uniref:uncharacterized protein LOC132935078 n=1 Tax=Metopolophium dirhodum TaxID=44670 RepID=UPI00298F7D22|nr:uncharacterized protein LOC132935078 [Metopolophium dirhodum]
MMSNPIEIDEIISNLRATITSNKGGVQLNCIESDYKNLIGEHIPYQKLGYNSLLEFLESLKVFKIKNIGFNKFVHVVSDGKTQHLEKMINKQKTKKSKRSKSKFRVVPPKNFNHTYNSYNSSMQNRLKKKRQLVNNFEKHTADVNPTIKENCKLPKIKYENKIFHKKNKLKVFAQDRLQKYEKKDIYQIEVKNEELKINSTINKKSKSETIINEDSKSETIIEDSFLELSEIFTKKCNIHETVYNIPIQPKQIPTYYNDHTSLKMYQYVFESKCKKIVTVVAVLSPSSICVVLEDSNTNAVITILNKLKLFDEFPFIKEFVIKKLLETKCILIPESVITHPLTVTLYDLETKMNINDDIISCFFQKVTPNITSGDRFDSTEAKLISMEAGYCYLQFNQDLIKSLEKLFSTDQFLGPCLKNSRDVDYKDTYLAYYELNIKGRVKVEYFVNDNQVKVFFIDYGRFKIVEVNSLIDLFSINSLLVRIPSQAIKVALHMFPPEDVTSRTQQELFNILGNNTNVSIYKLKDYKGQIPCVQLWNIAYPDTFINIILYSRLFEYEF